MVLLVLLGVALYLLYYRGYFKIGVFSQVNFNLQRDRFQSEKQIALCESNGTWKTILL